MNFEQLKNYPRLFIEVDLKPAQGTRFQPTGFPDLGAALYEDPDGRSMLLVESAQSMANRMENICWDEANEDLIPALDGLPYVVSQVEEDVTTNTILEAHRLNSPFIVKSRLFQDTIKPEIGFEANKPFDRRKLAKALLKYDPSSLIHGIFLEKVGGAVRLPRMLSGFIEASNVNVAASGGVKFDRVQPATGESTPYGKANEGYGNVPYHRDEYTGNLTAYFSIDIALMKGLGMGEHAENLLIALSLLKIQKVLANGMRLRTACDLLTLETRVNVGEFTLPTLSELEEALPSFIQSARPNFVSPAITNVEFDMKVKIK